MRRGGLVLLVALTAAAPVAVAWAQDDASQESATGGGEFISIGEQDLHPGQGPGDTIAFTAQALPGDGDAAEGEVQDINRVEDDGRGAAVFHGDVICLRVTGNSAIIAWQPKREGPIPSFSRMFVQDNGESEDSDVILVDRSSTPECVSPVVPDVPAQNALARGNVQVSPAP